MSTDQSSDAKKLGDRFAQLLDTGFTALGIVLGNQLGIIEFMAAVDGPKSSEEIARACKCKERYVREWLGFMVTADWMLHDEDTQTYHLSDAQKQVLTSPSADVIAVLIGAAGSMDKVMECFREDGPNGFNPGNTMMKYIHCERLKTDTPQNVDSLLELIPEMAARLVPDAMVCEIGCGIGTLTHVLGQKCPTTTFRGLDLTSSSIETAKSISLERDLKNVSFMVQDATSMPTDWTESYDLVFVRELIHDLPNPQDVLKEILRIMKPGGAFVMIDIFAHSTITENQCLPSVTELYGYSLFHCLPSSMNGTQPAGLGPLWGHDVAAGVLKEAGFRFDKYRCHEGFMIFVCFK